MHILKLSISLYADYIKIQSEKEQIQAWLLMQANPALRRLKQEDCYETGIALSYRVSFEPYWTTEGVFLNHSKGRRMEITGSRKTTWTTQITESRDIERKRNPIRFSICQGVEAEGQNCLKCWVQNLVKGREAQAEFKIDVNSRKRDLHLMGDTREERVLSTRP